MTFPITKDSYLHQWFNQLELQIWRNFPTKWVYKFEQVLTWLNIKILHHRSQHDLFIKLQIWLFITKTKESQTWDHNTETNKNANNASFSTRKVLPLSLSILNIFNNKIIKASSLRRKVSENDTEIWILKKQHRLPKNTTTVLKH